MPVVDEGTQYSIDRENGVPEGAPSKKVTMETGSQTLDMLVPRKTTSI